MTALTHDVLAKAGEKGYKSPELERNILALVDNIVPAVKKQYGLLSKNGISVDSKADEARLIENLIYWNVSQSIYDLFKKSAAVRELVEAKKVKAIGAVYDVATGEIDWFDETKPLNLQSDFILEEAKRDKAAETEAFAR